MIRFTRQEPALSFNEGRQTAFEALRDTLAELNGSPDVSEVLFRDRWLSRMAQAGTVYPDGWYSPPPYGTAVLFDSRLNFDSLRNPYNWSGEDRICWNSGLLYAYASPVSRSDGRMGDLSVTLYFGEDRKQKDHIRNCHDATAELFRRMDSASTAGDLFRLSQEIFSAYRLRSNVISRTDSMPINLGHTFERLPVPPDVTLTEADRAFLSSNRRFLNGAAEWAFEPGVQFTVEPQLVSTEDASLPKITQHYLIQADADGFTVCDDIDGLLTAYGLL